MLSKTTTTTTKVTIVRDPAVPSRITKTTRITKSTVIKPTIPAYADESLPKDLAVVSPIETLETRKQLILPAEVAEQIIRLLPVDHRLQSIGFASSSFGNIIFNSLYHAKTHVGTLWHNNQPTSRAFVQKEWNSLPANYKCFLFWTTAPARVGTRQKQWFDLKHSHGMALRLHSYWIASTPNWLTLEYLHAVVSQGHSVVLKLCNDGGVKWDELVTSNIENRHELLRIAISKGFKKCCNVLMDSWDRINQEADLRVLTWACCLGRWPNLVRRVLENSSFGSNDRHRALMEAARIGVKSIDCLQVLLENDSLDPSDNDNAALVQAATKGHADVFRFILQDKRIDPSKPNNSAFIGACYAGNLEIVNLLLRDPRVHPGDQLNKALYNACLNGHVQIVRLLLADTRVDPTETDPLSDYICAAFGNCHFALINEIFLHPQVRPAVEHWMVLCDSHVDPIPIVNNADRASFPAIVDAILKNPRLNEKQKALVELMRAGAVYNEGDPTLEELLNASEFDVEHPWFKTAKEWMKVAKPTSSTIPTTSAEIAAITTDTATDGASLETSNEAVKDLEFNMWLATVHVFRAPPLRDSVQFEEPFQVLEKAESSYNSFVTTADKKKRRNR
ncbi:UNVERIFIED_CONTAM: hypothetical protein HDU68_004183 [Siphonaria sp. JEL0065]|nr:hypothetical protein HDU68_004183 [Siphonaria sp. JEL0065]